MGIEIELKNQVFVAEVADSFLEKSWGLSRRSEGKMLFVFSRSRKPAIDMMLVPKPLYLYFLDSDGIVTDCFRAEPWDIDPRTWRLYRPSVDSKYLLESFEELDISEGDELFFDV